MSEGAIPHPVPWRWLTWYDHVDQASALMAADESPVITAGDGWISFETPYVRAVTESAPMMEALLRRLSENFHGDHDAAAEDIEEANALLARLDAAKGG